VKNGSNIFRIQPEPRNHISHADKQVQLVEYDDRIRKEEKMYSRLLSELSETYLFTRHVSPQGGFDQSEKAILNSYAKFPVDRTGNKDLSSGLESTRLTEDEILSGSDLTLDRIILEKKRRPFSKIDEQLERTNTQNSMEFQSTISYQEKINTKIIYHLFSE
jgi:hypothetical protein